MRALYVPLGLIALLLALSLWTGTYVRQRTDHWTAQLEATASAAQDDDWIGAERRLREFLADWEKTEGFLHTIMDHAQLDAAESLFAGAEAACRERDEEEFQVLLAQLTAQLRTLAETQSGSVKNIL